MDKDKMKNFIKNFKPMCCPICDNFYFSKPRWEEAVNEYEEGVYCSSCGWIYDYNQFLDKDLKIGKNKMSLNEYKVWYNDQLKEDPNFDYFEKYIKKDPVPHMCPVCGEYEFDQELSYDICSVCGWQDDGCEVPDDGVEQIGANTLTYSEHKKQFLEKRKVDPKYKWINEFK